MLSVVALALGCGLVTDGGVLEAVVRVESGGSPFALAVNGDVELVREPRSRGEAVGMARWLERHGYNFDAGLAQVNSANMARLGLDVASVFDPCANLRAASRVLDECFERALPRFGEGERALTAALSCYNTGHFTRGVTNGYVAAVRANRPGYPVHPRSQRWNQVAPREVNVGFDASMTQFGGKKRAERRLSASGNVCKFPALDALNDKAYESLEPGSRLTALRMKLVDGMRRASLSKVAERVLGLRLIGQRGKWRSRNCWKALRRPPSMSTWRVGCFPLWIRITTAVTRRGL